MRKVVVVAICDVVVGSSTSRRSTEVASLASHYQSLMTNPIRIALLLLLLSETKTMGGVIAPAPLHCAPDVLRHAWPRTELGHVWPKKKTGAWSVRRNNNPTSPPKHKHKHNGFDKCLLQSTLWVRVQVKIWNPFSIEICHLYTEKVRHSRERQT